MTQEELNYIKDAFSQIIDDIAGNPDWHEAASSVASDLGTLERELKEKVASLPSNLDEAAEKATEKYVYNDGGPFSHTTGVSFLNGFKAGTEWLAAQGFSKEARVWVLGKDKIPAVFVDDVMYLPENLFQRGDEVIVQVRKK